MPSQIDEFLEFYQDSGADENEEFFEEQVKRWNKLKHAVLVIFIVVITLFVIKCMKCWIKKENKKSKFEFADTFYGLNTFLSQF
jgi:heme/copper-type cytochrome/quinol oxidase subunit 2